MTIERDEDLEGLRTIGRIVARCLQHMADRMKPGMSTEELDAIGARYLREHGARSAPQVTYDFPGATCISVNEEVAHGIPGSRVVAAGDMVNIDVSAERGGYFADTGGSFLVPPSSAETRRLCLATRRALASAMKQARAGRPLRDIGRAIERTAKRHRFGVIHNLCSHGVGRALHEEPESIWGFDNPHEKRRLHEGLVITIEPFLTTGPKWVTEADDGWTLRGPAGTRSAQYEHTMVITKGRPLVMTQP